MPLSGTDLFFWAAGVFGHFLLLLILIKKNRVRQVPFFTALIAANIARSTVLYLVRGYAPNAYLWAYLALWLVDVSLQLAVVYEVASYVFRPLGRWAPDVRRGMHWLGWGSLAIASVLTWMAAPGSPRWEFEALVKANFFSSVLLSELFLGMIVLSVTVGLPWKTHVARIAQGMGAYSILDVLVEAGHTLYRSGSQTHIADVLTSARMVLYLVVLLYWIVTLWQEAPAPLEAHEEMLEELRRLQSRLAYDLYTIRNWRKP